MSKVFIVRLSRYSIYKVQFLACRSRGQLDYSITTSFVCQELFSSFFKLFSSRSTFAFSWPLPRGQLRYTITAQSICQELFSSFFIFLLINTYHPELPIFRPHVSHSSPAIWWPVYGASYIRLHFVFPPVLPLYIPARSP